MEGKPWGRTGGGGGGGGGATPGVQPHYPRSLFFSFCSGTPCQKLWSFPPRPSDLRPLPIFCQKPPYPHPLTPRPPFSLSSPTKPEPQPHLICIAWNAITELWFTGCVVSPPRTMWACKISWRGWSFTIWRRYSPPADSGDMSMLNIYIYSDS